MLIMINILNGPLYIHHIQVRLDLLLRYYVKYFSIFLKSNDPFTQWYWVHVPADAATETRRYKTTLDWASLLKQDLYNRIAQYDPYEKTKLSVNYYDTKNKFMFTDITYYNILK